MKRWFQRYTVHKEILSTFHAQVEYISVLNTVKSFKPLGRKSPKLPFPLGHMDPIYYTHPSTPPTHHPKWQLDQFTHFHTTMQQNPHWLQWDAPNLQSKLPLPLQWSLPPSNMPIPWSTPLTIPNGIQIQSAVLPQYTFQTDTDWHTETQNDWQMG